MILKAILQGLFRLAYRVEVRGLEHVSATGERAVIVARGPSIRVRELPPEVAQRRPVALPGDTLDLQAHERTLVRRALDRYHGNRRQAARALNISTVTLWRKMKEYGFTD